MLSNAAFAMANLDLISRVRLASFVNATQIFLKISHAPVGFYFSQFVMGMIPLRFSLPQFSPHSFPFHSTFQFQLVYQSCPVLPFLPQPVAQGHVRISQCEFFEVSKHDRNVTFYFSTFGNALNFFSVFRPKPKHA